MYNGTMQRYKGTKVQRYNAKASALPCTANLLLNNNLEGLMKE